MLWVIYALDGADAAFRRAELRSAHSARLRSGALIPRLYGPLTDDSGQQPVGSLLVVDAVDRSQVAQYLDSDPFRTGAVWEHIAVHAFEESVRSPARLLPRS